MANGKQGLTREQALMYGKRGGRPKGAQNKRTLLQEVVKQKFSQRILRLTDRLINAQASLAIGQQFLYKIEKEFVSQGFDKDGKEKGYYKNLPPKLCESQAEIEGYLEMLAEKNGDMADENDPTATYYFITTKEPNNNAIDSLHNRVHGKPTESLALKVEHTFSLKDLAERTRALQRERELKNGIIDAETKELPSP